MSMKARAAIVITLFIVTLALTLVFTSETRSHYFYSTYCCDDNDCAPIRADAVKAEVGGWRILATGELWPYADTQASPDGSFHWCEYPRGKTRCLYAPPMGS